MERKHRFGHRVLLGAMLPALALAGLLTGPVARAAQPTQSVVVFFREWSAALDPAAQHAIDRAAHWAKAHPAAHLKVIGYADPTGSKRANVLLSELRAQVVVDQLVSDGIAANRLRQNGEGSVQFGLTSQESRRVAISLDSN